MNNKRSASRSDEAAHTIQALSGPNAGVDDKRFPVTVCEIVKKVDQTNHRVPHDQLGSNALKCLRRIQIAVMFAVVGEKVPEAAHPSSAHLAAADWQCTELR